MRAHAGIGKFWIVRLDSLEDRDMRLEGDPVLAGIAERHASLVDQPIDDGPVHDQIDGILGDRSDGVVKRDIRVLKAPDVADGLVVSIERIAQLADILRCGVARCIARQAGFKERARILEMADAVVIREQIFGTARQLGHDGLSVRGCDPCSRTCPEIDESRPLQMKQRLADRRPAHAKFRHELTF